MASSKPIGSILNCCGAIACPSFDFKALEVIESNAIIHDMQYGGLDPEEYKSWSEETALHIAVKAKNMEFIQHILQKTKVDPNEPDEFGRTPIQLAVERKCHEAFRMIAMHISGEKLRSFRFSKGQTALHLAVLAGDMKLVRHILFQYNKDHDFIKHADNYGRTALQLAEDLNHTWIGKLIGLWMSFE